MSRSTVTLAFTCLLALTLATGTVFAQTRKPQMAQGTRTQPVKPSPGLPPGLVVIFNNLGPSAQNTFFSQDGWVVSGTQAADFSEQWTAMPFSPSADSHVTKVQAAIGYISGTNKLKVGLYADSGFGTPGKVLAETTVSNVPVFGNCCDLVNVNFSGAGIAVKGHNYYWVVASPDNASAPDFEGAWAFSNEFLGFNLGETGWFQTSVGAGFDGALAGSVLGTTP